MRNKLHGTGTFKPLYNVRVFGTLRLIFSLTFGLWGKKKGPKIAYELVLGFYASLAERRRLCRADRPIRVEFSSRSCFGLGSRNMDNPFVAPTRVFFRFLRVSAEKNLSLFKDTFLDGHHAEWS